MLKNKLSGRKPSLVQERTERGVFIFNKTFQSSFAITIIWVQFRAGNMQEIYKKFPFVSSGVIKMLHPTEHWRKHAEKWSGSAVSVAMETWVNVTILSMKTRVKLYVSAMKTKVSAAFPEVSFSSCVIYMKIQDGWNFGSACSKSVANLVLRTGLKT